MSKKHVLVTLVALCVPAMAYADWSGAADSFTYANGHDLYGNWGSPIWAGGDDLWFTSMNFDNSVSTPMTSTITDTMEVDLTANAGYHFTGLQITVWGDYTITGDGGESVEANFGVAGLSPQGAFPREETTFFADTVTGVATPWSSDVILSTLASGAPPVTELHVTVDGTAIAISDGNGTAHITVSYSKVKLSAITIPEPASLSLLAIGGLALIRRR